jgi:hypothetical protein
VAATDTERRLEAVERRQKSLENMVADAAVTLAEINVRMAKALTRIEKAHGLQPPPPKLELVREDRRDETHQAGDDA